jgi:hypothetical protein
MTEKIIHIRATGDVDDKILSELMNILIKHGFKTQKYLGRFSKIVMAKKELLKSSKVVV